MPWPELCGGSESISERDLRGPDAEEVARRLRRAFGRRDVPRRDPLDELILTILSQSTTDTNRDRAWRALRDRYPDWDSVRRTDRSDLEETIRVAGLARQKARTIQNSLERLRRDVGRLSLDHLEEMDDASATDYLTGFPGVGVKTAACVLCFSLRRPVLPVDTHVLRIARRLGWLPPKGSSAQAHRDLAARVRPERRYGVHLSMIALGREVCRAPRPRCEACPLEDLCPRAGIVAS